MAETESGATPCPHSEQGRKQALSGEVAELEADAAVAELAAIDAVTTANAALASSVDVAVNAQAADELLAEEIQAVAEVTEQQEDVLAWLKEAVTSIQSQISALTASISSIQVRQVAEEILELELAEAE